MEFHLAFFDASGLAMLSGPLNLNDAIEQFRGACLFRSNLPDEEFDANHVSLVSHNMAVEAGWLNKVGE